MTLLELVTFLMVTIQPFGDVIWHSQTTDRNTVIVTIPQGSIEFNEHLAMTMIQNYDQECRIEHDREKQKEL